MPKTRSSKTPKRHPETSAPGVAKKKEAPAAKKTFWKGRLANLCKKIETLEKKMLPFEWTNASYDLFDACRVERTEVITRINWILHTQFGLPPNPAFHRSTQIEVALSLLD